MHSAPEHRLEDLARQKLDGKTYSSIRKELATSGMKEEEISQVLWKDAGKEGHEPRSRRTRSYQEETAL